MVHQRIARRHRSFPAQPTDPSAETAGPVPATCSTAFPRTAETEEYGISSTGATNVSISKSGSGPPRQRADQWLANLLMAGRAMEGYTASAQHLLPLPV